MCHLFLIMQGSDWKDLSSHVTNKDGRVADFPKIAAGTYRYDDHHGLRAFVCYRHVRALNHRSLASPCVR